MALEVDGAEVPTGLGSFWRLRGDCLLAWPRVQHLILTHGPFPVLRRAVEQHVAKRGSASLFHHHASPLLAFLFLGPLYSRGLTTGQS